MANVTIPVNEMNSFDLPKVCVITGSKDNITFQDKKFSWVPPWARLFGALIQALVARRANGQLPFSPEGWEKHKGAGRWMALGIVGMFAIWFLGGIISGATNVGAIFAIFLLGPERRWWQGTAINPFALLGGIAH